MLTGLLKIVAIYPVSAETVLLSLPFHFYKKLYNENYNIWLPTYLHDKLHGM